MRKMVKIVGCDFSSLDPKQVGMMIREYLDDTEVNFDKDAIYEFIDHFRNNDIERLRRRLVEIDIMNRGDGYDGFDTAAGRIELKNLYTEIMH